MDLSKFETDVKREEDGVWIDLDEKSSICVARLGNEKYKTKFQELSAPYLTAIRNKTLGDTIADRLLCESLAHTVLVNWKGLTIQGEEIVYSPEEATKILMDPKFKNFREMIVGISTDMDNYKAKQEDDLVKNS